jgi:sulfatase modifying factor 1
VHLPVALLGGAFLLQLFANVGAKESATPSRVESAVCPADMVEVEGDYCPRLEQTCLWVVDRKTWAQCGEFLPSSPCEAPTRHERFCMDRFEWPNQKGVKPSVYVSWVDARDSCASKGKRLCGDSEWTLACEGQEHLPYPYGYFRNSEACNIDKPIMDVTEWKLAYEPTRAGEIARVWQGEPSGAREACVSPYGVHDLTGNVDEWVINESNNPYQSGLKGGYWGPVRTRCRPMTDGHHELFQYYQIGFRCCGDPPGTATPEYIKTHVVIPR